MEKRILIVDDDLDICLLLKDYLEKLGLRAMFSTSVDDAFDKLSHSSFDALFTDLSLGDGSGFDLIDGYDRIHMSIPVVVISADKGEREKARKRGVNLFLAKPFTRKELVETLEKLNALR